MYQVARGILGSDFITPEEVSKARPSIVYTDKQITALVKSLPSQVVLKWCKDNGYAVIPAPPKAMSMLDVQEIQPSRFYTKTGWYADQKFAHEDKTSFGWLAIKKKPILNSIGKNWSEQKKLLSTFERVPNSAVMSWFITTYFEVRSERLFENVYVRTSSLVSDGDHVGIGGFDADGLYVDVWHDDSRTASLGLLALAGKFDF